MEKRPAVYMLTNRPFGTLYIGVTSNLLSRVWQHREDSAEGFSRTHQLHCLVWYEMHATMHSAISREKQLKHWRRSWKIGLIVEKNQDWRDLWLEIIR
jgi:putative endonuclease